MANIVDRVEEEVVWVHIPDPDCLTGCDYCLWYEAGVQDSPWTWAQEHELEFVVFGDFELKENSVNFYTDIKRVSQLLLKLIKAVRARKSNDGKEPCANAQDCEDPCGCCEGFKTATNVEGIFGDFGNLEQLEEDVRKIRRFVMSRLREALGEVLPMTLPPHVLDIMLEYMEVSFNRGRYQTSTSPEDPVQKDWRFVDYNEEDVWRLKAVYKSLSVIFNVTKNNLFVDPSIVPTTCVSDFSRVRDGWLAMMNVIREMGEA